MSKAVNNTRPDPSAPEHPDSQKPASRDPAAQGSWNQRVWKLTIPMILSNVTVPLLGAVDTAVMGHLPDPAYIGAVAVASMVFSYLYWSFAGFLRMGTTGFTAQAKGAEDTVELRAILARAFLIGGFISLLILALQAPIAALAFSLVDASGQVTEHAQTYFSIRIWGAPATLFSYGLFGWLLGLGQVRTLLILQIFTNGINILLNLVFVLGLGMTVDGVALATLIAEYLSLALGLFYGLRLLALHPAPWQRDVILSAEKLKATMKVNADIMIRSFCLTTAFAVFTTLGARMDTVTLAANAVLGNLTAIIAHSLDGFAHAAEVLVGRAVGEKNQKNFSAAVKASSFWALVTAAGLSLVFWLFGPLILTVFTNQESTLTTAQTYLPWMFLFPVISVAAYQLDGIFIGATRTTAMRNAMVVSLLAYLGLAWLLVPLMGNHGLWLSLTLFLAARGGTLLVAYPALLRSIAPAAHPA
ncbi:MATE family efflux transporter [Rhodovibrionaceae bacterium A322]